MKRITILLLSLLALSVSAQDDISTPQLLTGTLLNTKVDGGAGKLKKGTEGIGFYAVAGSTVQNANTAFIAEKRTLLIDLATLDNPMTDIKPLNDGQGELGTLHDLAGRKMDAGSVPAKGIYIKGKKKTLQK